ncbi:MAG: molecular chaperone HtpG [Polyangiaceae bacterium]
MTASESQTSATSSSQAQSSTSHAFVAEVSEVLKLVIHSLYSHKEIAIRELVSNASDALDKLRFRAITEPNLYGDDNTLEIRIRPNKDASTLTIEDTGIGMTEAEMIKNLGTVAHSGTRELLKKLEDSKKADLNLIGQFGVGFYSAYLVADRVDVYSRAAGHPDTYLWSSDAKSSFTVERVPAEVGELVHGTRIVLHLKEDAKEFLEPWKLTELVKKYSDYVSHPIRVERKNEKGEATLEQANRASALWRRPKSEITDEQYTELYKHIAHDYEAPLAKTHIHMEGTLELSGVLFVPKKPTFDLFDQGKRRGVQLFVKRVFIMDDCEELLPPWLRFMKGVVDSDDLPLNVSREILQDSSIVRTIRKHVVKKSIELLESVAESQPEDYAKFFRGFGVVLKEGVAGDTEYKDKLAKLLRFESTNTEGAVDGLVSLDTYKSRVKEGQKEIYYLYGSGRTAVAKSPYLEALESKGYEVLLMTDPVDEWVTEALGTYEGLKFVSAMGADLSASESTEEKSAREADSEKVKPLLDRIKTVLGDRVKEVKTSSRLLHSPACLALGDGQIPAYMEAVLRANGRDVPKAPRVFEVNTKHPLIEKLLTRVDDPVTGDAIELLFDQAKLLEGSVIDDPQKFAERLANVLAASLT